MQPQFQNERTRLINGKVIRMAPASNDHGQIELEIGAEVRNFVKKKNWALLTALKPDLALIPKTS